MLLDQKIKKKIGDEILQVLPSFDFGRIAAQTAKQVISFNVREAERDRQFNDFIDKKILSKRNCKKVRVWKCNS